MIHKIAILSVCLLFAVNTLFAQSGYFFKTTETLELEKWDAMEASKTDVANAIVEELNNRTSEKEKVRKLEEDLNEKLRIEDYFGANEIKKKLDRLELNQVKSRELRQLIESSINVEDYEKAAQYKADLLSLLSPPTQETQNRVESAETSGLTLGQEYGGGYVFFIDGSGAHGLIAAKADYPEPIRWGVGRKKIDLSNEIDGATNSRKLSNEFGSESAAGVCEAMTDGGFDDWYLPSISELSLMYRNKDFVKDIGIRESRKNSSGIRTYAWKTDYISSTQHSSGVDCMGIHFANGKEFNYFRSEKYRVRAIRKF